MARRRGFAAAALGIAVLAVARSWGKVRRYAIAEGSMAPALSPGDWVVARRLTSIPKRGAIVVFPHPDGRGTELVKRVVALPGETVAIANGQVHVDGSVLAEPWADGPTLPDGDWALSPHEVFVLGDARPRSTADSRHIGPVTLSQARWEIAARYWPLRSVGRV